MGQKIYFQLGRVGRWVKRVGGCFRKYIYLETNPASFQKVQIGENRGEHIVYPGLFLTQKIASNE